MTMERRHFEFIANVLRDFRKTEIYTVLGHQQHNELISAFANACAETNPQFKRDTFLKAAGYERKAV